VEANPIPVKWVLQEMGLIKAGIRLPMVPLSAAYHDALRAACKPAQLL
jgi:4-hydroxy-tetrahydrodipicolinate synthase